MAPTRAVYAAFDVFPSAKGAGTHIAHAAGALFDHAGGGRLVVCGQEGQPAREVIARKTGPVIVERVFADAASPLGRAQAFARHLACVLEAHRSTVRWVHCRDPWGAVPAVAMPNRTWSVVFEVNGLPSTEMAERYVDLPAGLLSRIAALERSALDGADRIVVPSSVTASFLVTHYGVTSEKVHVIPNGADVHPTQPRPADAPETYLLYFGALQPWQGIHTLFSSLVHLRDLEVPLVVCASLPARRCRRWQQRAERLGLDVRWHHELDAAALQPWVQHARASVAPLTRSPRNVQQGCCPLKVLESMAAGTPVIASDLPVVTQWVTHRENGWLVPPERPEALARAIRLLVDHPALAARLGQAARQVAHSFSWETSDRALRQVYAGLPAEGLARTVDEIRAGNV